MVPFDLKSLMLIFCVESRVDDAKDSNLSGS